ncbi:MAG: hypothetical protein SOZ67_04650 [Alloprevotella sp.]|uniref:hypothetical protein n=1 Tax=Prevotellamassilia timonensis TaxID=1852370 RepID=UPI001F3DEB3C|nr:hypothetical protein [Prevotellamassilia timonensis]MCI5507775.1 hypothetical protein [Bacteroidales bacterium]MDY2974767.1 hypothetical protein [Alloprevotella sp.]MCF2634050.1 hypothetical protein [Prevotellamassilia timonensis]MCI6068756.1 hypothetical protein [Bacteroidales bacterium]MDD6075812.1 hypothetical protein [Bacteroidales bacterium]
MKKRYIQPQTEQFALSPVSILAASGGSGIGGGWTPEELPEDYEEIGFGGGSKVPD